MTDWYTCSEQLTDEYLVQIGLTLDDIGNDDDELGYKEYSVQRTEPFGETSYIQIYYDSFLAADEQLDYECVAGCEYATLTYIGRTAPSDQTGDGFYNGYLVLALTNQFNREDQFILALYPTADGESSGEADFYSDAVDALPSSESESEYEWVDFSEMEDTAIWDELDPAIIEFDESDQADEAYEVNMPMGSSLFIAMSVGEDSDGDCSLCTSVVSSTCTWDSDMDDLITVIGTMPTPYSDSDIDDEYICGVLIYLEDEGNTIGSVLTTYVSDLQGNTAQVDITVQEEEDDGIIEFLVDTTDYIMVVFNVEGSFNWIEFMTRFYTANTFFSAFAGLCFVGAVAFDGYLGGLLWFEYKRDELYLSSDVRFGGEGTGGNFDF